MTPATATSSRSTAPGRQRHGTRATLAAASEALAQHKAEAAEHRAKLAAQRRAWRTAAYRASMRAAELRKEQSLAKVEAELAATSRERQRLARAIRELPPDLKALGDVYTFVIKALQKLDRGAPAAEGMRAIRARAAYEPLYEAEDTIKRALFGDETERRGRMHTGR